MRDDLLSAVGDEQFDAIVSNPPYLPLAAGQREEEVVVVRAPA